MKRYFFTILPVLAFLLAATFWTGRQHRANAHCQVPCGIYDDLARIRHLKEDATTIAKSVRNINNLAGKHDAQSLNQATRWIMTKEQHASHVIEVVSQYFLTQKVKPVSQDNDNYKAYLEKLADHHAVMVAAMKTKQKANPTAVDTLNAAIDNLSAHYVK